MNSTQSGSFFQCQEKGTLCYITMVVPRCEIQETGVTKKSKLLINSVYFSKVCKREHAWCLQKIVYIVRHAGRRMLSKIINTRIPLHEKYYIYSHGFVNSWVRISANKETKKIWQKCQKAANKVIHLKKGTNCQRQQTLAWLAEKHLIDESHY